MSEEEKEFKKQVDETLRSIYSKIDEEEKIFLSYLVGKFNSICERNFKAIEYIEELDELENKIDDYAISKYVRKELMVLLKGDKE